MGVIGIILVVVGVVFLWAVSGNRMGPLAQFLGVAAIAVGIADLVSACRRPHSGTARRD